jgi:glycosyltransferase involved in cell wall biosynthesis
MRLLCHNVHAGYDAEMAKSGHEFMSLKIPMNFNDVGDGRTEWDDRLRPKPANWTPVDSLADVKADVAIAGDWGMAKRFGELAIPLIYNNTADSSEGVFPQALEERVSAVCFLCEEVADRWALRDPSKKRVIPMGIDETPFFPRLGEGPGEVLTVGRCLPKRWDKGYCQVMVIAQFFPVTLAGPGNWWMPGAVGTVPQGRLLEIYRDHKVYFNPGPIIGISVAEAMMAGMPVVTFRPINLKNLFVHGENGFVVDTLDGAILAIRHLLEDCDLRRAVGAAARKTALEAFSLTRFVERWDALFREVVARGLPAPAQMV